MASSDIAATDVTTLAGNLTTYAMINENTTLVFIPRENSIVQRALSYTLTAVIAVIMIGVGCGVDVRELKPHFLKPVGITVGFLCQFCKFLL